MRRLASLVEPTGLSFTELQGLRQWELYALEEYHMDLQKMQQRRSS